MQIYQVYKNYQASDSDGWSHWCENESISFHSSLEGASSKIKSLIDEEFKRFERIKSLNPDTSGDYWIAQENNVRNNIIVISDGRGSSCSFEEYPIYDYRMIDVLD
jgi:hypothetical protein